MIRIIVALMVFAISAQKIIITPNQYSTIWAWLGVIVASGLLAWVLSGYEFDILGEKDDEEF